MTEREQCVTQKVTTQYGSHYVHVTHEHGRVTGLSISSPGKFDTTAIADMLAALSEAANAVILDIIADRAL